MHYLKNELRRTLTHFTRLQVYRNTQFMVLDAAKGAAATLTD